MLSLFSKVLWSRVLSILSFFVPKNGKLILFGAYSGGYFGDNSGALYQYFINHHKKEFHCVWLTDDVRVLSCVRSFGGVAYLKSSYTGIWLSLRAAIIIATHHTNDVLLYNPIFKRPKVLFLHHGAPNRKGHTKSKHGVFKNDTGLLKLRNEITCMIATSLWGSDRQRMLIPVLPSQVKITGYPRNDFLFKPDKSVINSIQDKYDLGNYIVLYATTWRKWAPVRYFPFDGLDLNVLCDFLEKRKITIIIRPHSTDLKRQKDNMFWKSLHDLNKTIKVVTRDDIADVQPLLYLSNCLITDYSSIYHDYLLLNRPIIYLSYDYDVYSQKVGGFNMDYDEFSPGPKPKTQAEFIDSLEMLLNKNDPYVERRLKIRDIIHEYKDGQACSRVYKLIKEMIAPV